MSFSLKRPSYYELVQMNKKLYSRPEYEIEDLILTMIAFQYNWNDKLLAFHNERLCNSISVKNLDWFTAESFKQYYSDLCEKINADPELYHAKGKAKNLFVNTTLYFIIAAFVLLIFGWFILPFELIAFFFFVMLFIEVGLFIRFRRLKRREMELEEKLFFNKK